MDDIKQAGMIEPDNSKIEYAVYSPSYKRADIAKTHKLYSKVRYVVKESEAEEYRKIHDRVWAVPDNKQGSKERVMNHILDTAPEENIVLIDDDMNAIVRWDGCDKIKLDEAGIDQMILEGFQLAQDMDVVFWGINLLSDKGSYREYTPFGTKHYIGGPFHAHRNNPLRYDEEMYLKEDFDMTLQVLSRFRKNLRLNMYSYECEQATITGGYAEHRSQQREMKQFNALQKKWGSEIIKRDTGKKKGAREKMYDINPIMKVPIRGV